MSRSQSFMLYGVLALVGAGAATVAVREPAAPVPDPVVTVYKSPTCGCCRHWVEHLREAGFTVVTHDTTDLAAVKTALGVPRELRSCHTAVVEGYVLEGHVPADLVSRLLVERPEARGLAVPGMPVGAPGMEQGDRRDPYDVLLYSRERGATVYARR